MSAKPKRGRERANARKAAEPGAPSLYRRLGSFFWQRKFKALQILGLVLGTAAFLAALVALGKYASNSIQGWERYSLPFNAIECSAPPGISRADFLSEVQYLSGMPDQIHLLDSALSQQLFEAFAKHPRVENVDGVVIVPPKNVQVRLRFRQAEQSKL
jgi:hypothetical protein